MCLPLKQTTTGRIYLSVIEKERREKRGNGPSSSHITNEIKDRMQLLGKSGDYDVIIRNWWNCRGY
jgi:CTP synthase